MRKSIYFIFAAALIFACSSTFAQSTLIVMKAMDGATKLNGGSIVAGHSNEIDVFSDSQGEIRCDGCGKATLTDFSAMINLSAATIALKKKTLNGTFLTSKDVVFIKA